jgi:rubrerythrin
MVTLAGTQNDPKSLIEALLKLEYNALEAYDETIERLEDPESSKKIAEFRQDHYQHVQALTECGRPLGVEVDGPGGKSMLTAGKIKIADMVGNDSAILKAMKTNEYETVMAYENAMQKDFLTPELRALCEKGLNDERRHRDWMDRASEKKTSKAA